MPLPPCALAEPIAEVTMEAEAPTAAAAAAAAGSAGTSAPGASSPVPGSPGSPAATGHGHGEDVDAVPAAAAAAAAAAPAASRWADLDDEGEGGEARGSGRASSSSTPGSRPDGSALGKRPRALLMGLDDEDILSSVDRALGRASRPAPAAAAAGAAGAGTPAAAGTPGASSSKANAARPILVKSAQLGRLCLSCAMPAFVEIDSGLPCCTARPRAVAAPC